MNDAILALIEIMQGAVPALRVTRGALTTGPGVCCEAGQSRVTAMMDGSSLAETEIEIRAKHENLKLATEALLAVLARACAPDARPSGAGWAVAETAIGALPRGEGRNGDGMWIVVCSVKMTLYMAEGGSLS